MNLFEYFDCITNWQKLSTCSTSSSKQTIRETTIHVDSLRYNIGEIRVLANNSYSSQINTNNNNGYHVNRTDYVAHSSDRIVRAFGSVENDRNQVSCLPPCLQRLLLMDSAGLLSAMDKSLLKVHLVNGCFNVIKCGDVTNVKVSIATIIF